MLDSTVFSNVKVVEDAQRFVALRVDMTNGDPPIAKRFGVSPPAVIFFDSSGKERNDLHLVNVEFGVERFRETLKKVS